MTNPLSPATRAIKDAVLNLYKNDEVLRDIAWELEKDTVVVALRAAVDAVVPENANPVGDEHDDAREDQWMRIRYKFLSIVAELDETK
jgi:hypothetical protein